MTTRFVSLAVGVLLALLLSPAVDAKKKRKVERQPIQVLKPELTLALVDGYESMQHIGGVRIEVTAVPFTTEPMYLIDAQDRETALETWGGIRVGGKPIWISALPFYQMDPVQIELQVRITNQLGRVLRLNGVALQFVKDGQALAYDRFINALDEIIILPNNTWEGVLKGPSLQTFGLKGIGVRTASEGLIEPAEERSEGTLIVGLYDIVTELDDASNPTVRSNFEWIYTYRAVAIPEVAETVRWKAKFRPGLEKVFGVHPAASLGAGLPGTK